MLRGSLVAVLLGVVWSYSLSWQAGLAFAVVFLPLWVVTRALGRRWINDR